MPSTSWGRRSGFVAGLIAVAVIAVGAVVLAALALLHVRAETPGALAPVDPIALQTGSFSTATPTPTPTATPAAAGYPRADELFLAAGADTLWRGRAGGCGSQPLLQRSDDRGATWTDVTPTYLGIAQLLSVAPLQDTQASIVATVGASCTTEALRTFTQGQFWESATDTLTAARWIDSADPAVVHLAGSTVAAPCADARGLRASDAGIAIVCAGAAWQWIGSSWQQVPVDGVVALAQGPNGLVLARADTGCAGVALLQVTGDAPQPLGCAAGVDPHGPVAIAIDGADVLVWAGGDLTRLPLS